MLTASYAVKKQQNYRQQIIFLVLLTALAVAQYLMRERYLKLWSSRVANSRRRRSQSRAASRRCRVSQSSAIATGSATKPAMIPAYGPDTIATTAMTAITDTAMAAALRHAPSDILGIFPPPRALNKHHYNNCCRD